MQFNKIKKCIVYIGDYDLRNENVQSHLVKNNAKIFNKLGYKVVFVGVNRFVRTFQEINSLPPLELGDNCFLELPNTLNIQGLFKYRLVFHTVFEYLTVLERKDGINYVITYQSPTYAPFIKKLGIFCKKKSIPYIVNSADIPIFDSQTFFKRIVMKYNWHLLHKYNYKYASGVIAVSSYIDNFYKKEGRPSIIVPPLFDESLSMDFELGNCVTFVYAGTPFIDSNTAVNPTGMKDRLDKIIDLLLNLAEVESNFRCVIIGITKEKYCINVPRHSDALKDNNQIIFKGRLPHSETLNVVKNADYMINYRDANPMTEAGLSTKVVESVSLGTPVVMNSIGDTFNYLKDGLTGYKLTGRQSADVTLLRRLCDKNEAMRQNSKKACANNKTFSLEKYSDTLDSFFRNIRL